MQRDRSSWWSVLQCTGQASPTCRSCTEHQARGALPAACRPAGGWRERIRRASLGCMGLSEEPGETRLPVLRAASVLYSWDADMDGTCRALIRAARPPILPRTHSAQACSAGTTFRSGRARRAPRRRPERERPASARTPPTTSSTRAGPRGGPSPPSCRSTAS